jgi:hypothetical protein
MDVATANLPGRRGCEIAVPYGLLGLRFVRDVERNSPSGQRKTVRRSPSIIANRGRTERRKIGHRPASSECLNQKHACV